MKIGTKVMVKLKNGGYHKGEYLGEDPVLENTHKIGVTESTVPMVRGQIGLSKPKPGKKYISIFYSGIKAIKEEK